MRDIFPRRPTAGHGSTPSSGTPAIRRASRPGFTLVEVLMVVLIISMLVALLLPAVQAARIRAIKASITMDVNELITALEAFKSKYGSYPPSRNWTVGEIGMFLHRAFPRY